MSDAPAKKRPWFQLHLSTCVVLMFVAGFGVWLNVRPQNGYFSFMGMAPSITYTIIPQTYPELELNNVYINMDRDEPSRYAKVVPYTQVERMKPNFVSTRAEYGWPYICALNYHSNRIEYQIELTEALKALPQLSPVDSKHWYMGNLALDAIFWAAAFLVTGFILELAQRHLERKRAAEELAQ